MRKQQEFRKRVEDKLNSLSDYQLNQLLRSLLVLEETELWGSHKSEIERFFDCSITPKNHENEIHFNS